MSITRPAIIAILAFGLSHAARPAHAQAIEPIALAGSESAPWNRGVPKPTRDAARDLFLEGNRLFRVPLFARAAEKYREALAKWDHPAFYFNLALAQLNLGDDLGAHNALETALRDGEELLGAPQVQEARKQLRDLEHRLGRVRVRCPLAAAEVAMDGQLLFSGPGSYEGWVAPKPHEITARKPEYLSETRRIIPIPGKVRDVELTLITLDAARDAARRWAKWKPWAVVIAGGAVAAASGALHVVSARTFQQYDAEFHKLPCATPGCSPEQIGPALNARLRRATLEQKLAVGGYIAGGAVLAAGIALVYLDQPRLAEQPASGAAPGSLVVTPIATGAMVGVAVTVHR